MKKICLALMCFLPLLGNAQQKTAGTITYEYQYDWLKAIERNKFMSKEERERALQTWKNDQTDKTKMQLVFNTSGSNYERSPEERGSSWQKTEYKVDRDFTNQKVLETQLISGKVYTVEDSLYSFPWKIKSEIKEVAGYLCMLATTYDSLSNSSVDAWFTTDIPVNIGPEDFMGLPGMILEVNINDGVVNIAAVSVKINESQELPKAAKKTKGKKYKREEYELARAKYIKDMEAAKSMPWGLRY